MITDGIFVTGTDTGVGKTIVTAALSTILRTGGINAIPMKPVQTGYLKKDGILQAPDLDFVLNTIDIKVSAKKYDLMCPYRFEAPCSPHLAAERKGSTISIDYILRCFHNLKKEHKMIIVEGAGGIMVPLTKNKMILDLMQKLNLPVVLVARPGLGTINHTLLSLQKLNKAGLQTLGVIFNEVEACNSSYIEQDNSTTIERIGKVSILGHMPFIKDLNLLNNFKDFCIKALPSADDIMKKIMMLTK